MNRSFSILHQRVLQKYDFSQLKANLKAELKTHQITPHYRDWFRFGNYCNVMDLKVLILGQDPYPGENAADGLAFSTRQAERPKSLDNIFKVIKSSYPTATFTTNSLESWAQQGVLLLNTCLTSRVNAPLSHHNLGWHEYVGALIVEILHHKPDLICVCLGNAAMEFWNKYVWPYTKKDVLFASHPSPLGWDKGKRPFKTSQIFKEINDLLGPGKKIDFSTR
ncbi:uracil-DNA glycosylase [Mycoplasmopsis columbinasalis]|uniref:uracil-DNA glycosylase n=1 Tax=Mycoplasmopsis columbinasalis TaxID=114880 RepID=A0A449BAH7_9BACT|nr:uracil-DNA glycosylase [Mycoplasmopsis columbinasalis]VEU78212.1 uracil-DNA glycosylase [Mycoplasmopsis columbinasalis]